MDKAKIERINVLAKKKKSEGLNAQETAEQKQLYKEYLANIRQNVESQMNSMVIDNPDGTSIDVKNLKKGKK